MDPIVTSKPLLLSTPELRRHLRNLLGAARAGQEVWLLSPYIALARSSDLRCSIAEAALRGVRISLVVRDERKQRVSARRDLAEAVRADLTLQACKRLHAKLYWFEGSGSISTSANLISASFRKGIENGFYFANGEHHERLREWIDEAVRPGLRLLVGRDGHCIRCGISIPRNVLRPLCAGDYEVWRGSSHQTVRERRCHECGIAASTTKERPRCRACYDDYRELAASPAFRVVPVARSGPFARVHAGDGPGIRRARPRAARFGARPPRCA